MGVRTLQLADRPVEVWYPVESTAVEGQSTEIVDSINLISEVLRPVISGSLGGGVDTGAYRDAPAAVGDGPFPIVAYSHGGPGYRQAATFLTGHLASHGVITIAVEHLGRSLSTLLTPLAGFDTPEDDVADLLHALDLVASDPGLSSVADTSRMVVIGHSAGARTAALATADDRVVGVVLLAGVQQELVSNRPALMVAFENDALIDPVGIWSLHESLDNSVFLNIARTGHAAPLDACPLIQDRGGLTELREALGEELVRSAENGCLPTDTDARAVQDLLRIYITGFVYGVLGLSTGPVDLTAEAADLVAGVELRGFNEPPTTTTVPTPPSTTAAAPSTTISAMTTVAPETAVTANINWISELLAALVVTSASAPIGYDRDDWGSGWADEDSDCLNTRHEVLISESLNGTGLSSSGCSVVSGQWYAAFTGTYVTNPSSLDVDHFVPLANAHDSGGWAWSLATKRSYYNDLVDPQHLIAVTASANRSKGSRGPEEWKPSDSSYWCQYADSWVDIKVRWGLTVTPAEFAALQVMLGTCDGPPTNVYVPPAAPSITTTTVRTATTTSTTAATGVVPNPGNTKNCSDFSTYSAAKAWFDTYFPYYGDVARLDGDNDGEPCESLPGGP